MAKKKESAFDIEDDDFDSMFESSLGFAEESESEPVEFTKKAESAPASAEASVPAASEAPEQVEAGDAEVQAELEAPAPSEPQQDSVVAPPAAETVEAEVAEPASPEVTIVAPRPPVEGSEDNVIQIPVVEGVEYVIGDDAYVGEVEVPESGLTIYAYPLEGYALSDSGDIEWSFDFIAPPPQKTEVAPESVVEPEVVATPPATPPATQPEQPPVSTDDTVLGKNAERGDSSDFMDNTAGGFDPNASQADNLKSGIDRDVSLETLEETIKVLDAYRALEDDEAQFSGLFIGLNPEASEAEVVSTVMNADPLLLEVFSSIKEAKNYDDTEVAFYVVGLKWEVLEGISYVASQYLDTEVAEQGDKSKIPYAREVVAQIKKLDTKALRLVDSAEALIAGEIRDKDADLSH